MSDGRRQAFLDVSTSIVFVFHANSTIDQLPTDRKS